MDLNKLRLTEVGKFRVYTDPIEYKSKDNVLPIYLGSAPHYMITHPVKFTGVGLDIGCGSGILSLSLAQQAQKVISTDINSRALEITKLNAKENGLSDRIETRLGSLWEPVINEKFDFIISNPPFVPHPEGERGAIHTLGGVDGLKLTSQIINDLPNHLTKKGKAQIYTLSFGRGDKTLIEGLITERFKNLNYKIIITNFYSNSLPLKTFTDQFKRSENYEKWMEYLHNLKIDSLHSLIITFEPSEGFIIVHNSIPKSERKLFPDNWGVKPGMSAGEVELHWQNRFTYWLGDEYENKN